MFWKMLERCKLKESNKVTRDKVVSSVCQDRLATYIDREVQNTHINVHHVDIQSMKLFTILPKQSHCPSPCV